MISTEKYIREFKVGAGNVLRRLRMFIPFFVCAFIIESMFISLLSVGWSIERYYVNSISEEYTYHYILEGMDSNTYSTFHNALYEIEPIEGELTTDIKHETYRTPAGEYHRLYITLNTWNFKANRDFNEALSMAKKDAPPSFICVESPLKVCNSYLINIRVVIFSLWVIVFLISVFILVSVYRVRISHYRFMYGVYMTCGADYKKLVSTAISEMLTVFLISLLPAFLFSVIIVFIIFKDTVMNVSFLSPVILYAVLSSVGVILAAVGIPMRLIASEMPINLINKGGTAQYVISPRRSAKIFGKSFPFFYELLSIKRFAKYYILLLSMCVVLNSLFITGLYAGELSDDIGEAETGTIQVSAYEGFSDESLRSISEIPGVDYPLWENSKLGLEILSYMNVSREQNISEHSYTVEDGSDSYATFGIRFRQMDPLLIEILEEKNLASFEGNPEELFTSNSMNVVISRDIQNLERFDFKVGDYITISISDTTYEPIAGSGYSDERDILSNILNERHEGIASSRFTDFRLRICAIVDYEAPEGALCVGLSPEMYKLIGCDPNRTLINIHTSDEISTEEESRLFDSASAVASLYDGWKVERTFHALKERLSSDTYILGVFIVVALFVLVGVPVLWLFSQKVFYEKREDEIELLRCIGSNEAQLKKLYLSDGLLIAGIAFVFTIVFSAVLSAVLYVLATLILPFFGFKGVWKLEFRLSPISLLISGTVCAASGLLASLGAYYKTARKRFSDERDYMKQRKENGNA